MLRPFNEARFELQLQTQLAFLIGHLAIIALVVEACQMENSVQGKNFYLCCEGVSEALGTVSGNFRRNRQIASRLFGFRQVHLRLGKRQYVGRLVLSAKSQI